MTFLKKCSLMRPNISILSRNPSWVTYFICLLSGFMRSSINLRKGTNTSLLFSTSKMFLRFFNSVYSLVLTDLLARHRLMATKSFFYIALIKRLMACVFISANCFGISSNETVAEIATPPFYKSCLEPMCFPASLELDFLIGLDSSAIFGVILLTIFSGVFFPIG